MDVTGVPFVDSCVKIFRGCTFDVQALQIFPVGYFANSSNLVMTCKFCKYRNLVWASIFARSVTCLVQIRFPKSAG